MKRKREKTINHRDTENTEREKGRKGGKFGKVGTIVFAHFALAYGGDGGHGDFRQFRHILRGIATKTTKANGEFVAVCGGYGGILTARTRAENRSRRSCSSVKVQTRCYVKR